MFECEPDLIFSLVLGFSAIGSDRVALTLGVATLAFKVKINQLVRPPERLLSYCLCRKLFVMLGLPANRQTMNCSRGPDYGWNRSSMRTFPAGIDDVLSTLLPERVRRGRIFGKRDVDTVENDAGGAFQHSRRERQTDGFAAKKARHLQPLSMSCQFTSW